MIYLVDLFDFHGTFLFDLPHIIGEAGYIRFGLVLSGVSSRACVALLPWALTRGHVFVAAGLCMPVWLARCLSRARAVLFVKRTVGRVRLASSGDGERMA